MARKLTDQERENIELLRVALTQELPPAQRGIASGIASALVRIQAPVVTDEDLSRILDKYDEDSASISAVVKATLLDEVQDKAGEYTLRIPAASDDGGPADPTDETERGTSNNDAPAPEHPDQSRAADADHDEDKPDDRGADPQQGDALETSASASTDASEVPATDGSDSAKPESPKPEVPKPEHRSRRAAKRVHKTIRADQLDKASTTARAASSSDEPERPGGVKAPAQKEPTSKADSRKGANRKDKDPHDSGRSLNNVPYVRRGGDTEAQIRQKIVSLDQRFWMNGWLLSHPAAYTLYERELTAINDALNDGMLPGDITRRQLAYQMGGDEKFFEYGNDGFKLLRAMGMEDVIRHRPLPKPDLVYYAPRRRKHMRVLVTENLDPYLDVHDLMYEEGRTSVLGVRIHAVVLGGGTPVLEHNRLSLLLDTLGAESVEVVYWGDIDRAGLDIMVRLRDVLGDKYKFSAFTPAYQLMVQKAQERFPDPADNERTGQINIEPADASLICDGLTEEAADYAKAVIQGCGLIPQEILTRRDL